MTVPTIHSLPHATAQSKGQVTVHLSAGLQAPPSQIIEITGRVNPDGKTFVANELAALSDSFDLCVAPARATRIPTLFRLRGGSSRPALTIRVP